MDLRRVAEFTPRPIDDEQHDAGVLIPVIERDDGYYLLFTKRADHLGKHPGQMSFPGGGNEPVDQDIRETALREAYEEIGMHPDEVDLVGRLDDIRTITEYAVTPFVGIVPDREYEPNEREVAEVAILPVDALVDPLNYEYDRRDHPHYGDVVIHYFHVDGYTVWGATGRILVQFLELTTDWRAPERIDRRI
ncbi:NUDIX hydrolase [Haloarchaeobius sp. TZWWS8]|uniref:NUDIX hydrolase n=1 Tax=Haloarchaeobius sp. TZWWS8 TaxID=3446121 RepID=UPI003EB9C48F